MIELTRNSFEMHKLVTNTCNSKLQVIWDAAKRIKRELPLTRPEVKIFLKSEKFDDPITIRIYFKMLVTEMARDYMFSLADFSFGDEHVYEIIKALYWSLWVQIDPKAADFKNRPKYIENGRISYK